MNAYERKKTIKMQKHGNVASWWPFDIIADESYPAGKSHRKI